MGRGAVYARKRDQRELIKVCQRQFRSFMSLRDWGWYVLIQKTRPLIGLPNPQEELRALAEKAEATYGKYKQQLDEKERLLLENVKMEEENKALMKQIDSEQGNVSQYHEKQARITEEKALLEQQLVQAQNKLSRLEQERIRATGDKKSLEQENITIKKE